MSSLIKSKEGKYIKIVPDAYHGTDFESACSIKEQGFKYGKDSNLFLGSGIYFYEGCEESAKNWCKEHRKGKFAVLQSVIDLDGCLDLNTDRDRERLKTFAKEYNDNTGKMPEDGTIIDIMVQELKLPYYSARFSLSNWKKAKKGESTLFLGSKFLPYAQLIICVYDLSKILETHIIYKGEDNE